MSREAWGDPPDREPDYCPVCGETHHTQGCPVYELDKRRIAAEDEVMRLRAALAEQAAEQAEPVEVTPEMLKAGAAEWLKYGEYEAQFPLAQGFDKLPRHLQVRLSRATHVYRAMRAAAPPAPARQEWQPIETAPDGVMLLFANMKADEARHWAFCGWRHSGLIRDSVQMPDNTARSATHWQPLPAAPITAAPAEGEKR